MTKKSEIYVFVRNLILNRRENFVNDDVINVTSFVNRTQSVGLLLSPPVIYHGHK